MGISKYVEILAKEANIVKSELAKVLKCSPAYLSSIMSGKRIMTIGMAEKIYVGLSEEHREAFMNDWLNETNIAKLNLKQVAKEAKYEDEIKEMLKRYMKEKS